MTPAARKEGAWALALSLHAIVAAINTAGGTGTFDELFGTAVDFAVKLLTRRKEFFPFGYHAVAGNVVLVGADPGLGEQPPSPAVLDALYEGSWIARDDVVAIAFVGDVRLPLGSDPSVWSRSTGIAMRSRSSCRIG